MSKSNRTCYFTDRRDLWAKERPLSWWASNKKNKVMSHRIERAWTSALIYNELQKL